MIRIEKDDFGTLAICAIRYCHGRQTYMPNLVQGIIRPRLKELSDKDLNVMIEDCDFQERMHLYGDERIDKPGWLKWKADLIAERELRESNSLSSNFAMMLSRCFRSREPFEDDEEEVEPKEEAEPNETD